MSVKRGVIGYLCPISETIVAKRLYIGNLSYQTSATALRETFAEFGEVSDCTIIDGKGFGFIEYASDESAQKAIDNMNGTEVDGRQIRVDVAHAREERRSGGGGGGYGGGGERRDRW